MNREGKSYRRRQSEVIILVVSSRRMSASTTRHTVIQLVSMSSIPGGRTIEVDEVPVQRWEDAWEEV